jgi:hypothetical protein
MAMEVIALPCVGRSPAGWQFMHLGFIRTLDIDFIWPCQPLNDLWRQPEAGRIVGDEIVDLRQVRGDCRARSARKDPQGLLVELGNVIVCVHRLRELRISVR